MPIDVEGLDKVKQQFQEFKFKGGNVKYRFLQMIGAEALDLLRMNTPRDTGALADGWVLQQSENAIDIINDQQDLLSFHTFGTIRHIPNPFISRINGIIRTIVMDRLKQALGENMKAFKKLGKGRKHQQVGRTSAGFTGGISFAGRATLVRAGTGRRQLKRRISLRRRRGAQVKGNHKVKVG